MKKDKKLLDDDRCRKPGFRVPEEYFEQFTGSLMEKLPEKNPEPEQKTTLWMLLRPWIYMAAMFAGIACMVKLFSWNAENGKEYENLSLALSSGDEAYTEYIYDTSMDEYSVYECIYADEALMYE